MIRNKVLDDLYNQRQKLKREQLELERTELNLKIELQELLNGHGRKGAKHEYREDHRLRIS